jgi:uncharacterized cupredoxin-like copper-binding protein
LVGCCIRPRAIAEAKNNRNNKGINRINLLHKKGSIMKRLLGVFVLLMVLAGFALAQEGEEGAEIKLEVSLKNFAFTLEGQGPNEPIMLESGKTYAFEFKNEDNLDHEILWGSKFMINDQGQREDYETNLFEEVEVIVEGDGWEAHSPGLIELELKAGKALEVIVTIPEEVKGQWEMGCFVPGHHEAGMHTPIVIQ